MPRKKKVDLEEEGNQNGEEVEDAQIPVIPLPSYIVERAKSGRADCKKCDEKIQNKEIRIGVIMEGEWGLFTRWQHLDCTVFHKQLASVEAIDGFKELSSEERDLVCNRFLKSKDEIDDEFEPLNPDEIVRKSWTDRMEPSDDLLMPLLPYQKEGLGWLYHQEQSSVHGGILADEMGMGKTIQGIALILANRPDSSNKEQIKLWQQSDDAHEWKGKLSERGNTLIIVPTVAIRQWQMEIARFTKEGCLKVKVYHGADRTASIEDILSYDVIITSYKILEIEYRKATAGTKVECRVCGKKFYPEKLRVHRKYFCGATAQRTEAQAKTQKKTVKGTKPQKNSSDVESDDSITKEKKKLKLKVIDTKPAAKISSKKKVSEQLYFDESSEDEITKQKKAIKAALNDHKSPKGKKIATSSKPNGKRKKNELSSSSEEEKMVPKKRKGNNQSPLPEAKNRMRKNKKTEDTSSEFEDSSEGEPPNKKSGRRASKRKTPRETINPTRKNSSSKKKVNDSSDEYENDNSDDASETDGSENMELNDSDDEDVERDIQEALLLHAKAMKKSNAPKAILHQISWFRIILDEAHLIKDRSTSTSKAVFNLVSLNKWCLTGTPLQNRVSELYSLIRFLRIDPYAYYFCRTKECTCKSLHYRFTKSKCDDCGHSVISHYCQFNRSILNPIQRSGYIAEGRKAMLKLKQQILDEILLRRTKTTRADDILLPTRIVRLRQEKMDEKEEDFYQALYTQSQAQFNTYLQSGTVLNNYAHIFDILIRLRQAVDHPYLVIHSESQKNQEDLQNFTDNTKSTREVIDWSKENCDLCSEPIESNNPVKSACGHLFCNSCIMDYIETMKSEASNNGRGSNIKCPTCHEPLTLILDPVANTHNESSNSVWNSQKKRKKSILDKIDLQLFQTSTKMEALMEELYKMEMNDVGSKAIVFSQFVNMLDLLEYRIEKGGIRCVKLLGSMTVEQRDKAVAEFRNDPTLKVLLISLKAGGVALNLTVANHIFLMDPWWNPAAEMQAIDRTHRIGQYKPIYATRFIIENSIEERIIKLQEKKKLVFDGTVGYDQSSMTKLTVDDMRFLFQ